MLGHARETLAVVYLQRGPLIAENKYTTHRRDRRLSTINRVSVLHVFLSVCACSVTTSVLFLFVFTYAVCPCLFSHVSLCSLLIHLYGFVSLYTQLLLILFIHWSSPLPLFFNKLLISLAIKFEKHSFKPCLSFRLTVMVTNIEALSYE